MSPIIKFGSVAAEEAASSVREIAFNFDDMGSRANSYLDDVRKQAAKILEEAQSQAQAIRRMAENQGRQAAMQAVDQVMDEKVHQHMQTLLPAIQQAVTQIEQSKQQWLNQWQSSTVQLATQIAERVIRRRLESTPEIALDLVREALELAAGRSEVVLHLNPTDLENLGGQIETITRELGKLSAAQIVGDSSISPGGCRVETRFGQIDQQFEAQLARIEEELAPHK